MKVFVIVGVACVFTVAVIVMAITHSRTKERDAGRRQLVQQVDNHIATVTAHAGKFEFNKARRLLAATEDEVRDSPFADVETYDRLNEKIAPARKQLAEQEEDYRSKIKNGWVLIDGSLISPSEKDRVLEERRRKAAEEQAEQARIARRQEEERQQMWSQAVDLNLAYARGKGTLGPLLIRPVPFFKTNLDGKIRNERELILEGTYRAVFTGPVRETTRYDKASRTTITAVEGKFNILSVEYDEESKKAEIIAAIDYYDDNTMKFGFALSVPVECTPEEAETMEADLLSGDYEMRVLFNIASTSPMDGNIVFINLAILITVDRLTVEFAERK